MTKKELNKQMEELREAAAALKAVEDVVAALENAADAINKLNDIKEQLAQSK